MYPEDEKPIELREEKPTTDPVALLAGAATIILMAALSLSLPAIAAAAGALSHKANQAPFEYIEARILKQGEIKDPDKLPDRVAPALATAPEDVLAIDSNENKPEQTLDEKPERQRQAVSDDKLREVLDKARAFAEVQDDYVPEGHPDGVPDGDVTDPKLASLGDTYGRKISRLIAERWAVPTLLSEEELRRLSAKVLLRVDIDMAIVSVEFTEKSKNRMFDDTIKNAIDLLQAEVKNLPAPPEAIAPIIFGGGILLRMNGSDAHYQ